MKSGFGKLSDGERSFVLAHLATAVFGAGLAFSTMMRLTQGAWFARPLTGYESWIILCGAMGGALGLYLCREQVGRGPVPRAIAAILLSNLIGAVIGGTLALPLYGTMFGPFALLILLAGSPLLIAMWLANQLAVHLLLARFHAERDSIFVARPPAQSKVARPSLPTGGQRSA